MKITDEYVFFYKDWLSNYQKTNFTVEWKGTTYTFSSTEKGFMYIKAITFGDSDRISQLKHILFLNGTNPFFYW